MLKVNGKLVFLFLLLLFFGFALVVCNRYGFVSIGQRHSSNNESKGSAETIKVKFFEKSSFYDSINNINNRSYKDYGKVWGSILPHHLLASDMIAENIKLVSTSDPKKIIILGPNHDEKGDYKIITGSLDWETEIGLLKTDDEIKSKIQGYSLIGVDNKAIENDHSVSGIMPFIKYYLPNSVVTPFILKSTLTLKEMEIFSKFLQDYSDNDTVIIASTDFSHYLKEKNATLNDVEIFAYIKNFDIKNIFNLNNDYLDSPPSVITLLMVMTEKKTKRIEVIGHSNSALITNNLDSETTSYYSIIFTNGN